MRFERGDIVRVDLNPVIGHEQGKTRPVLVMNDVPLPGNLHIILPITSTPPRYPLEVVLDGQTKTQGTVLCFQIRAMDLAARNPSFVEKAPKDIVEACAEQIRWLTEKID